MEITNNNIEEQRFALQISLDTIKNQYERNELGQFHTPAALADDLLKYGLELLEGQNISFLDPATGTGTFFSSLINNANLSKIVRAVGYEVDSTYASPTVELWKQHDFEIKCEDFTKAKPQSKFNLIVCNPPYVRHHHIKKEDKDRLQKASFEVVNRKLSGLAGLYCHFLIQSHPWMTDNGFAAWLIPSEFMDVNYGSTIKKYLLEDVTLLHIHRFDPADVQFTDALVSSAIVWIKKAKPPVGHRVRFSYGGTLFNPVVCKEFSIESLNEKAKWTRLPFLEDTQVPAPVDINVQSAKAFVVGDFFRIKRGLATGANDYFLLTEAEITEKNLPFEFFRPILPGPKLVPTDVVEADSNGNPIIANKLYLLDSEISEQEIKLNYPSIWAYLEEGKQRGVHNGYLCRSRSPWYNQEKRPPAPIVCTYMGRSGNSTALPFRFILNKSKATMTNGYLALYPTERLEKLLNENPNLIVEIWESLNMITKEAVLDNGRVYGGGLHKLEPKELARVPISLRQEIL